jgi:hypothetical protein
MNTRQLNTVESLLNEHQSIKDTINDLDAQLTKLKEKIFGHLEDNALETLEVGEEGSVIRVTIVRPTTLKIDEAGLEQALTKPQWKLITKQVVDKKALEDAVVRGKIDTNIVADQTKEVASKPYLRITG